MNETAHTHTARGSTSGYELLLRWASECGGGTWLDFREAHDWLFNTGQQEGKQVRATTTIHALAMLGHLEIDWESGTWAIAPSAVTILPNAGAHAIVTGARTHRFLENCWDAVASGDYFGEAHDQEWGPDAVFVAASDEGAIELFARTLGIDYEVCVSERLAKLLPPLDSYLALCTSTPGAKGYGVERLDAQALRWERAEDDARAGLYRYDVWGRPEYRYVSDERNYYSVDLALGTYAELRRTTTEKAHYRFSSVNGTLQVPFGAQLPTLHARAAVLCTGLMPYLHSWTWHYSNVPIETAKAIARSLGQTLVIDSRRRDSG